MLRRVALARVDSCHPDDEGDTFPETSVLTIATPRNIPEHVILHSHCRGNLKSYEVFLYGMVPHRHIHIIFLRSLR
jgi:hypothetical protein